MKEKSTSFLIHGFAPILILFLVAAIGTIGYFSYKNSLTSSNSPLTTSNPSSLSNSSVWKTYTNDQKGFIVAYPSQLKIKEYKNKDSSVVNLDIGDNCIKISSYSKSEINNIQGIDLPISDYVKYKNLKVGETRIISYEDANLKTGDFVLKETFKRLGDKDINGENWFQLEKLNNYENNGVLPRLFTEKGGNYWSVVSVFGAGCDTKTVNQILSTFKFTK